MIVSPVPGRLSPLHICTMAPGPPSQTAIPRHRDLGKAIWIFMGILSSWQSEMSFLETTLTETEYRRAQKFYFKKDRRLYTLAHGLLRLILGRITGIPPSRVPIEISRGGKPHIADRFPLDFNLSHSDGAVALALSTRGKVGIDIERIRPIHGIEDIIHAHFHTREVLQFHNLSSGETTNDFFRIWTQKEAVLKATGMGFSCPMNRFTVRKNGGDFNLSHGDIHHRGTTFMFLPIPGYCGAAARIIDR